MSISISTPATLDSIAALLATAGYTRKADSDSAGWSGSSTPISGGFRRVFWITADNLLVLVQLDGAQVDCGDDGEGMVAGDEPVDDLGEVASALGLRPDDDTLRELRLEAGRAGDVEMIKTIDLAMDGDLAALVECSRSRAHDGDGLD